MTIRVLSRARLLCSLALLLAMVAMLLSAMLPDALRTSAGALTDGPLAGSQGTDTALPTTPSEETVVGRGVFADLAITVNQTANLTNQAVSITWTGGRPTIGSPGRFGGNYLQIFQCWGDDDLSVPGNPGPPPEQCEQGAVAGTPGGLPGSIYPAGFSLGRVISRSDWPNFDVAVGHLDTATTNVWLPFRAVDGTVVDVQADVKFNPSIGGGNYWLNPYFNITTTNEIAGAVTGVDGRGAELFQVVTGVQSSALGCGQQTQPLADGTTKVPSCWIVVVPRGTAAEENIGTPFAVDASQNGVVTSPISPAAWKNRIAIPLEFNPVDSPCALGAQQRRISGSELALPAVVSWQPLLCGGGALPPFSYSPVSDSAARQQLVSGQPGTPGLIVVSQPLPAASVNAASPPVYAPLSLSGVVIGFNIERNPLFDAPEAAQQLAGVRVAELNLTPRLVAKLLTQSYREAVSIKGPPDYPWMVTNPAHMGLDPDFRVFNPEFDLLQIADGRAFSGLQLPAGNSDAAEQVWEWVLADPEARTWLDGAADEWGMRVNPIYATVASANVTGSPFADPLPNSFPKADPYCYQAPARGTNGAIVPPPLCGTDWLPYRRSFADIAQVTRTAFDGARIVENPSATSAADVWTRELPQFLGRRAMLALTDAPAAAKFGIQTARLSRAGAGGSDRAFIAADDSGLTAGALAMMARSELTVLEPAPLAAAPTAYPLTTLTYGVITPLALDTAARSDYAAFIDYASGPGQVAGLDLGQLPRGYVSLPESLRAQATAAANLVRTMVPPPPVVEPVPVTEPTTAVVVPPAEAEIPPAAPLAAAPANTVRPYVAPPLSGNGGSTGSNGSSVTTAPPTSTESAPATEATIAEEIVSTSEAVPPTTAEQDVADTPATTNPTVITPIVDLAKSRWAIPGLGVMALGSALGALEITKRPRRRLAGEGFEDIDGAVDAADESGIGSDTTTAVSG